jgi:LPXTG-motif cell wall-anchored protein
VPAPRRIAALAVSACLLASPAAALAQGNGAGDEQYSDPFAPTATKPKPKTKPQAQASPSATTTQQTAPAPAPSAATTAPATQPQSTSQLPRTGYDVIPVALLGLALIGAGVMLLRRRRA